jgi:hypothetical protein
MKSLNVRHLVKHVESVEQYNNFAVKCKAKNKVAAVHDRDRFYLGTSKMGKNKVHATVTLTMLNEVDDVPNGNVQFLMDTGAECNVLSLNV